MGTCTGGADIYVGVTCRRACISVAPLGSVDHDQGSQLPSTLNKWGSVCVFYGVWTHCLGVCCSSLADGYCFSYPQGSFLGFNSSRRLHATAFCGATAHCWSFALVYCTDVRAPVALLSIVFHRAPWLVFCSRFLPFCSATRCHHFAAPPLLIAAQ